MRRPRFRRERDTRFTVLVAGLGVIALLVTTLALLARTITSSWQPAVIAAAFAHQLMWAAPAAVVLLLVVRRWTLALIAVVGLALAALTQAPLYRASPVASGGRELTVLQANLMIGAADPTALVRTVRDHAVDVLMTEELTTAELGRLVRAGLSALLPHRFAAPLPAGGGGLAVWSRFPLSREVNHDGYSLGVLSARARVSSRNTVTVFAVHLLPPYPYPAATWVSEIGRLRGLLHSAGGQPAVVGGDFNATTDNAQFRALLGPGAGSGAPEAPDFSDAAESSGAGYLVSYPTDRWFGPVIAIDHVLTSDAAATDASTVALPGSDHRGLLVHVRLPS